MVKILRQQKNCPLCQKEISFTDSLVICPNCGTLYHARCAASSIGDVKCLHCDKVSMRNFLKW